MAILDLIRSETRTVADHEETKKPPASEVGDEVSSFLRTSPDATDRDIEGVPKYEGTKKPPAPGRAGGDSSFPRTSAADEEWARRMRAAFAPVRFAAPRGCVAKGACRVLGPCDRHQAGMSCTEIELRDADGAEIVNVGPREG